MTNNAIIPSALTFENTELSIIDRDGLPWVTSSDLSEALGYASTEQVGRLFRRNSDEFNSEMSQTVKLTGRGQVAPTQHRLFSPRGAHLIAMLAKTPKAKAFRKWVLDVLEGAAKETPEAILESDHFNIAMDCSMAFHKASNAEIKAAYSTILTLSKYGPDAAKIAREAMERMIIKRGVSCLL